MGLQDGNKEVLTFRLLAESTNVIGDEDSIFQLLNKVNETKWMGREPYSCRIVDFQQVKALPIGKTAMLDHAEFEIKVGYRPDGWYSDLKPKQRYNGWRTERLNDAKDGTLLDENGRPLPEGREPIYLSFELLHTAEFNDYDFGTLVEE